MKKTLTALLLAATMAGANGLMAQEQLLAFPGAEGFGRYHYRRPRRRDLSL